MVLDTETTGLDPEKGDRVIEIGAVELLDHIPTGNIFHVYLNPERKIPKETIKIHNITDSFIAKKPIFKDIAKDFMSFIDGSSLIIHNAEFDIKFLKHEFQNIDFPPLNIPVIDTLMLARKEYPGSPVSLDSLCKRFNIDITTRKEKGHGALTDSLLLSEVYLELKGGKAPKLSLDNTLVLEKYDKNEESGINAKSKRPKPLSKRLFQSDIDKHQKFLKNIGCEKGWKHLNLDQFLS